MADLGVALRRMEPRVSSLEDVFLAAGHAAGAEVSAALSGREL
jgi:hypothetical protein